MIQINGPAISVWISWIVIILTSQDTWSHVSLCTVEIWYILERCAKWSPGTVVMYSNRLYWPTSGCIYSWFIFEGRRTFKWNIKWHRRLKYCWLCGITGIFTAGGFSLFLSWSSLKAVCSLNRAWQYFELYLLLMKQRGDYSSAASTTPKFKI